MSQRQRKDRPHVSVNMAMSLDGRISTRTREQITLGTRHDRHLMDVLRAQSDAVIVGAGTVRLDGWPIRVRDDEVRRKRRASGRGAHPLNVVMTRSLDLPIRQSFFTSRETERIVYTTRQAPRARVDRFSRVADVVVLPRKTLSPAAVLADLHERGVRKALVEGGGELHFAFAREHLVDEIYITLTPRLIGGVGAPSILDGKGFLKDEHLKMKLVSNRRVGDELFLRYRVLY